MNSSRLQRDDRRISRCVCGAWQWDTTCRTPTCRTPVLVNKPVELTQAGTPRKRRKANNKEE